MKVARWSHMLKHLDDDTLASTGLQACQKCFLNVLID